MRGIDPNLSFFQHMMKFPRYFGYFIKSFFVFEKPLSVIFHYLRIKPYRGQTIGLRNGLRICLSDNPLDASTVFVIFVKEDYGKIVRAGIVIDIGANIGVFSLYVAQSGVEKIYAYEPNRSAYNVLLRNISVNGLEKTIIPRRLAVSGCDRETVKIPLGSSPYNKIMRGNTSEVFEEVSTVTLDTIISENNLDSVDLVKIDCEGAEYEIIPGLSESVFSRLKEIRMEFHDGPLNELISAFDRHNFVTTRFDRDSAMLWVTKAK